MLVFLKPRDRDPPALGLAIKLNVNYPQNQCKAASPLEDPDSGSHPSLKRLALDYFTHLCIASANTTIR